MTGMSERDLRAGISAALGPHAGVLGAAAVGGAVARVMRLLGPFPAGDPESMRRAAVQLQAIADETRGRADGVVHAMDRCSSWQGHAQQTTRAALERERGEIRAAADRLSHAAARLLADAGALERRQHEWRLRFPRLRDEAVGSLLAQARSARR